MTFYEHFADRPRNAFGHHVKQAFARKIYRMMGDNPGHILELGPGDGYLAQIAHERGFDYTALDGSPRVVESLTQKGLGNIRLATVPPLPADLGSFDTCLMMHIIEHLPHHEAAAHLLAEIHAHLRPGGKIWLATPDYLFWKTDFYCCDYTHCTPFSMYALRQLLLDEHFTIIRADRYVGACFGVWGLGVYLLARCCYNRTLDHLVLHPRGHDFWYRAFLTALPSVFFVAKKSGDN